MSAGGERERERVRRPAHESAVPCAAAASGCQHSSSSSSSSSARGGVRGPIAVRVRLSSPRDRRRIDLRRSPAPGRQIDARELLLQPFQRCATSRGNDQRVDACPPRSRT